MKEGNIAWGFYELNRDISIICVIDQVNTLTEIVIKKNLGNNFISQQDREEKMSKLSEQNIG